MLKLTSIRHKLIIFSLSIIIIVMIVVSFAVYYWLKHYYLHQQEEILVRSGNFAADFLSGHDIGEMREVQLVSLARSISQQNQLPTRMMIIDSDKQVLGDSSRIDSKIGETLNREEIRTALRGEASRAVQYSEEAESWVMQVAIPLYGGATGDYFSVDGVIFLSASLHEVYAILGDIRMLLFWSTVAAMMLAIGASFFWAGRLTEPLKTLNLAAQKMAEGELEQKVDIPEKDEIGRLANQFNIMADRLNYMTRNLKAFAANVSHELRTPLTTLSLLIKSLKEHDMEREQQKEFLDDLDQQTDRLINLVNDLLELTKLEHINIKEKGKHFSLRNILLELIEQMSPWFERGGINFHYDIPLSVLMISGSPGQIRQVFYNLLDNALKYTPEGGEVKLNAREDENNVTVEVKDSGKGIPANERKFIFERFYRMDHSRSRDEGGMGLGLAISKEIIEVHGGEIILSTEEGKGSVFKVILPKVTISKYQLKSES